MQPYTKNSKSAANDQSLINNNIDSAKKKNTFSSLENLIFFIDVAKKCEYAKLEDKIKSVGGTIKLFLADDVTHFITDRVNNVQGSKLSNGAFLNCFSQKSTKIQETADSSSIKLKITSSKTRSRVDEMIHRARLETSLSQSSLLDVALLKNIRIWDYNYANLYLNKIIKKLKLYKSNGKKGINDRIHLTEPFIKIEDCSSKYRPYYKILKSKWPFINLINCELDNSKTSKQDLLNESKFKKYFKETDNNKIDKFGYCELCKCEYDKLSVHLQTEQHFLFASDQQNYEALDKLINEKINVKYFFEENFCESKNKNKQIKKNMTKLQYHDYFSRSHDSEKGLCVQGKINRVTRQGVNLEQNSNGCKKRRSDATKNNSKSSSDNHIKSENNFNYITEIRKSDKESQNYAKDNSSLYYKVIKSQSDSEGDFNNKTNDKDVSKPAIIVKFRKIRQSELSILNGEAENFMFPKTKTEIENNKKQNSEQKPNKRKYSNIFSVEEKTDEKIRDNSENKKRPYTSENKSRSEINNYEYLNNLKNFNYSFERIPNNEPWYSVFCRQDTGKEHIFEFFGGTGYKKLPYEMGHIPLVPSKSYKSFCVFCKSKGESNEYKTSMPEHFVKKEDEIRIKLESDIAIVKEKYNNNQKALANSKFQQNLQHQIEQQHIDLQQQQTSIQHSTVNKPFKKFYLMNLDMPRKSPREHASTLAMLSCLVKKSNSSQNSVNNDSKEATPEPLINVNRIISTPSIENDQDSKFDCKELQIQKDIKESDSKFDKYLKRRSKSFYHERMQKLTSVALEKEIDYFLQKSYSDSLDFNNPILNRLRNSIDLDDNDFEVEQKEKFLNDVNLNDILERSMKEDLSYNRPLLLSDGLTINSSQKKRPINKTGWPYKKKLLTRRQKGCITGFHHHKGVLVKKSSPWSIISNISGNNDDAINEKFTDILNSSSAINCISSIENDSQNIESTNLEESATDSLEVRDEIKSLKEIVQIKNTIKEDFVPHDSNQPSTMSTASTVPSSVQPISETKSRTQLRSPTIHTTGKVNSISPPSPRVLRKPRGRWYRER